MAIFVFRMKTFSRSGGVGGKRSTSAAAYRAGERIHDERTGATYDHRRRQDVMHKEIVLPRSLERSGGSLRWARDRASLWNAAEHAETRRNSRVAREFMVALPHELKADERIALARGFARELVERYHHAIDLVIHAPRTDPRNFHAHLLATTREVTDRGLSRKTDLELSGTERHRRGLLRWSAERHWLRERWAALTNEALKSAQLDVRVSQEYGARDPATMRRLPSIAYHIERRGGHSVVAARMRERHHAALEQRSAPALATPAQKSPAMTHEAAGPAWFQRLKDRAQSTWTSLRQRLPAPLQETRPTDALAAAATVRVSDVSHRSIDVTPRVASRAAAFPRAAAPPVAALEASHSAAPTSRQMSTFDRMVEESLQRWKAYRAMVAANPDFEKQQAEIEARSRQKDRGLDLDLGL